MRIERRVTSTEDLRLGQSITSDRNTDVNVSISRSYTQGQKVNVLGKETTVRTSVNLGLTGVYSRRSGETIQAGQVLPQNQVETDRVSINGTGSYGFSDNVTGNVELGFGQTRNLLLDEVTRTLRVEFRAQFTF